MVILSCVPFANRGNLSDNRSSFQATCQLVRWERPRKLDSLFLLYFRSDFLSYSLLLRRVSKDRRSVLWPISCAAYHNGRIAYGYPYQDPVDRR
jgi:hypothetical protein